MERIIVNNPDMLFNKEDKFLGIRNGWVYVDPNTVDEEPVLRSNGTGFNSISVSINTKNGKIKIPSPNNISSTPQWVWTGPGEAPAKGSWYFQCILETKNISVGHGSATTYDDIKDIHAYWVGPGQPPVFPTHLVYHVGDRDILLVFTNLSFNSETVTITNGDYSKIKMNKEQIEETNKYYDRVKQIKLLLKLREGLTKIIDNDFNSKTFDCNKYFLNEYSPDNMTKYNKVFTSEIEKLQGSTISDTDIKEKIMSLTKEKADIGVKLNELYNLENIRDQFKSKLKEIKINLPPSISGGKRTRKHKMKRCHTKKASK